MAFAHCCAFLKNAKNNAMVHGERKRRVCAEGKTNTNNTPGDAEVKRGRRNLRKHTVGETRNALAKQQQKERYHQPVSPGAARDKRENNQVLRASLRQRSEHSGFRATENACFRETTRASALAYPPVSCTGGVGKTTGPCCTSLLRVCCTTTIWHIHS